MKLTITINLDNAAFEEATGTESARILRRCAAEIDGCILGKGYSDTLHDRNGNTVGKAVVSG